MKSKNIKSVILLLCIIVMVFINIACFTIIKIRQPSSVMIGQRIKVKLLVRTEGTDVNPHHGILGLLIPMTGLLRRSGMQVILDLMK